MNFLFSSAPEGKSRLRVGFDWVQSRVSADGVARDTTRKNTRRFTRRPTSIPHHEGKAISFQDNPSIQLILSLEDYSKDELTDTFYNRDDLAGMLDRTFKIVGQIETGEVDPRVCTRGLEKMSGDRQKSCHETRRKVIDIVMDTQEQQWESGHDDFERIAQLSIELSIHSCTRALRDAKQDIHAARHYLSDIQGTGSSFNRYRREKTSILKNRNDIMPRQTIRERRAPSRSKSDSKGGPQTPQRLLRRKVAIPDQRRPPPRTKSLPMTRSTSDAGKNHRKIAPQPRRARVQRGLALGGNDRHRREVASRVSPVRIGSTSNDPLQEKSAHGRLERPSCQVDGRHMGGRHMGGRVSPVRTESVPLKTGDALREKSAHGRLQTNEHQPNGGTEMTSERAVKRTASMPLHNPDCPRTPRGLSRIKSRSGLVGPTKPLTPKKSIIDTGRRMAPSRTASLPVEANNLPRTPGKRRNQDRPHKSPGRSFSGVEELRTPRRVEGGRIAPRRTKSSQVDSHP